MSENPLNLATDLATATVGQIVQYCPPGSYEPYRLMPITRATKVILTVWGTDYNREGRKRGATGYFNSRIRTVDADQVEKIQREALRYDSLKRLESFVWKSLTHEQLAAVIAVLPPKPESPIQS